MRRISFFVAISIFLCILIPTSKAANQKLQIGGGCLSLALINDDADLIAGKYNLLVFYDPVTGIQNKILNHVSTAVRSIAVSQDKTTIAYLDYTWIITIIKTDGSFVDIVDLSKISQTGVNTTIKFSPDGSGLIFSGSTGILEIKLATKQIRTIFNNAISQVFDVSYASSKIAASYWDSVFVIDYATNSITSRLKTDTTVSNIAFNNKGDILAIADVNGKISLMNPDSWVKKSEIKVGYGNNFPFPGIAF